MPQRCGDKENEMNAVTYNNKTIDLDAARMMMDEAICESIHGTVYTEQEFIDAYAEAHKAKYGAEFAF